MANGIGWFYGEDGQVLEVGRFEDGMRTGEWKEYHENGNLAAKGIYIQDQKSGKWAIHDFFGRFVEIEEFTP